MPNLPQEAGYRCKCCGSSEFALRHSWPVGDYWNQCKIPLHVWDCRRCGLTFLFPIPTPEQYPGGGDWFSPEMKDLSRKYWFKTFRRKWINRLLGTKAERFVKGCVQAKPGGRFLDIGCGTADLLQIAQRYYAECVGVEPSPIAAEKARAKGFRIHESTIENVQLEPNYYDVILMDSVIEHVHDPVKVLKICHAALAKDGVVAMLTPKLGGPAYRIHGAGWNGFRHGYHTFLYTGKTLGRCMVEAGFTVLDKPKRDRPTDDILILWGRKT